MPDNNTSRFLKYGTNAIVGTILFLVILIAINWFAERSRVRLDLTQNKIYTISTFTNDLLNKVEDKVTITVYATEKGTPPDWKEKRDQLRELLSEYRARSGNRVQFTFKDPSIDPKIKTEAEEAGIEPQLMQQASATDFRVQEGYLGLRVEYKGKNEAIPALNPRHSLEYQLTRAINKITQISTPNIGILAPPGNPMMGNPGEFSIIPEQLALEGFKATNLTADNLRDLKDIDMLMVFDAASLSDESLFYIDQYIMNGGKAMIASSGIGQSGMGMPGMGGSYVPAAPSINKIIEAYGVRISDKMIEDWQYGQVGQAIANGRFVTYKDPLVYTIRELNSEHPVTKNIPAISMVLSSPIERSDKGSSGTIEVLISSSKLSRLQEGMFNMNATRITPPENEAALKSYDIAVLLKGNLTSGFSDQPLPVLTKEDGTTYTVNAADVVKNAKDGAQVVVIGNNEIFKDQILSQAAHNILLPMNAAEWMTRGSDILSLRSNQIKVASLKKTTEKQAIVVQSLILAGVPSVLVLFGLARWGYLRRKKANYKYIYGKSASK